MVQGKKGFEDPDLQEEWRSVPHCAGGGVLVKKACGALPLVYLMLVLVTAVNAYIPRMVRNHCTGHEHNKQASEQAKESECMRTERLQNPAIHVRHCLLFFS